MDFLGHFQNLLLEAVFLVRTEVGVRWRAPSTAAGAPLCPRQWMCPARPSSKAGRHLSCPQTPLRRRAVGAGPRRGPHARPGSWPRGLARRPWTLRGRRCWWSPLGCGALRAGAHVGGRVALRGPAPLRHTARLTLTTPGADTCRASPASSELASVASLGCHHSGTAARVLASCRVPGSRGLGAFLEGPRGLCWARPRLPALSPATRREKRLAFPGLASPWAPSPEALPTLTHPA